ncbi:hypothetical protein [Streptomyces sp. NPDC046832]|uniref:hypothetical protein n=1 Tax=Streptomyces sp. NPDC046832 TaxID=3155020 RepID=UPI0033F6C10A
MAKIWREIVPQDIENQGIDWESCPDSSRCFLRLQGTRQVVEPTAMRTQEGLLMSGHTDQRTALLFLVGGGAVYVALEHPQFGTALLVGVGVMALLHALLDR